jgi:hypothetical protein
MERPSKRNTEGVPGERIARELDKEKARLVEENARLQTALHLLLAVWPVYVDASLWEQ